MEKFIFLYIRVVNTNFYTEFKPYSAKENITGSVLLH